VKKYLQNIHVKQYATGTITGTIKPVSQENSDKLNSIKKDHAAQVAVQNSKKADNTQPA